jgi:hypothetical protein
MSRLLAVKHRERSMGPALDDDETCSKLKKMMDKL